MSDWKRQTKQVSLEGLSPEMGSSIREHVAQHNLGPILSDALLCIQTDSEKIKKGLFGKAETVKVAAILTPRWLVWAVDQPNAKAAVLSAQLIHVTVQDYAQTPFVKMIADSGLEVSGMFTGARESTSAFIGLEDNEAGNMFKEAVIQAAQEAKK